MSVNGPSLLHHVHCSYAELDAVHRLAVRCLLVALAFPAGATLMAWLEIT